MTAELFRTGFKNVDYSIIYDAENEEFIVQKYVWSVYTSGWVGRQIGSPAPKDKPFHEYGTWDYKNMIVNAIEEEANA